MFTPWTPASGLAGLTGMLMQDLALTAPASLCSSLFRFLSGKRESREGTGTAGTKKIRSRGEGQGSKYYYAKVSTTYSKGY